MSVLRRFFAVSVGTGTLEKVQWFVLKQLLVLSYVLYITDASLLNNLFGANFVSPTRAPLAAPANPDLPLPANVPSFHKPHWKHFSPHGAPKLVLAPSQPPNYGPLVTSTHPSKSSRPSNPSMKKSGLVPPRLENIAPTPSSAGTIPTSLAQPPLSPLASNCCGPDMVLKRGSQDCHCVYPIKIDLLLLNVSSNPNWSLFLEEFASQLGLRVSQIELINFYIVGLSGLNISMDVTPHTGFSFSASEASAINSSLSTHRVHLDPTLVGDYELLNITWFKPLAPSPAPLIATSPAEASPHLPSTPTSLGTSNKGKDPNLILIVGIVAAILIIAVISVLIICSCSHQGKTNAPSKETAKPRNVDAVPAAGSLRHPTSTRFLEYEELKEATNNFEPASILGEGGFGRVFKGVLSDGTAVAIKRLTNGGQQGDKEFLVEVDMLSRLQSLPVDLIQSLRCGISPKDAHKNLLTLSVGKQVGVLEPFLMRMAHGAPLHTSNRSRDNAKGLLGRSDCRVGMANQSMLSDEQTLRVCKCFYVALILSRLVQEVPVAEVCEAFKVARGMVQALQENAGRFASMVSVFCERLGWHDLEGLVSKFQNRVSFGVRAEIVELTTIPYVKGSRARQLYKAGLRTPQAIAVASISEIVKALFESSSWAAQDSAQRRIQLGVAKKIKNGARKIVLDKAEEARVAAFTAFKSLGLDVPQLPQPVLKAASDATQKEANTSSGEESTSSFVGVQHTEHVSAKSTLVRCENFDKVTIEIGQEKSAKTVGVGLGTPHGAKSTGTMQTNFGAENPAAVVEGPGTLGEVNTIIEHINNADMSFSSLVRTTGNEIRKVDKYCDLGEQEQNDRENACLDNKENASEKGPVNAVNTPGGFDSFLDLWDSTREFYFDIHFNKRSEVNSTVPFEIHGIAICWGNSPVYYVNLPKDIFWFDSRRNDSLSISISGDGSDVLAPKHQFEVAKQRWSRIVMIMGKKDVRKFTWNLKIQIQVLKIPAVSIQRLGSLNLAVKTMGLELKDSIYYLLHPVYVQDGIDMCIVAWILWPDEEKSSNPNLEKEIKKRLSSEAAAAASRSGRWKNQMRRAAHNGCCRRVAQIRALCSVLWKLLISEELVDALTSIEIPLVNVLADMEICGIGVDMDGCLQARQVLGKKLRYLEKEAYKLAGISFSLHTAADIANVLYGILKLPIPEGYNKTKQHPSTDKHCLDLLRHEHPIIPVIKEHRTLAKLLNCTLGSICSLARLSMTEKYTLHGRWLQTSTATGRLSMEEPNLQCVEHMVDFRMNNDEKDGNDSNVDHYRINARDFFVPTQDNWLLLAADYSQIELRMMAHFSKDASLIELLSKPHGDVFTMIAAKWTGKEESNVSSQERDQTKRLVYGILYGMGPNTLAEQLDCSLDDAAEKIQNFKRSFPGVASWLQEAVTSCRQKGYVETLKGRKRFLAKIKFGNSKEKSKAQRQAVNSICQGSAADIIKIAMINIHSLIVEEVGRSHPSTLFAAQFHMLRGRCRILLQVHDELVLEADPSVVKEAGLLLQMGMERAVSLLVPLRIKLMVGRTWGSLEPFLAEQHADEVTIPNP